MAVHLDRCQGSNSSSLGSGMLGALLIWRTWTDLRDAGADLPSDAATLVRLFKSKHVSDPKLFIGLIVWFVILGVGVVLYLQIPYKGNDMLKEIFAPLATILSFGGVAIGWVYRTASSRLGIVDLFAYEITTICRVGTIVDAGRGYRDRISLAAESSSGNANEPPLTSSATETLPHAPYRFASGENYFPVFEKNSHDLRILEAGVVTNVTAFYTYMKVVRDYLRRIADLDTTPKNEAITAELQRAWLNAIYMLFLGYEAARKSINDLIEYEPTHIENTMVILLTELAAYALLKEHFENSPREFRFRRLKLRAPDYEHIVNYVFERILYHPRGTDDEEREWAKAAELLDELIGRCHDAGLIVLCRDV
jgi:hypothetical protein